MCNKLFLVLEGCTHTQLTHTQLSHPHNSLTHQNSNTLTHTHNSPRHSTLTQHIWPQQLSRTQLSHTYLFTLSAFHHLQRTHTYSYFYQIHYIYIHIYIYKTFSHTHNLLTRNSFTRPVFCHLCVFPAFPIPCSLSFATYWKKLTCGLIRSGIFFVQVSLPGNFQGWVWLRCECAEWPKCNEPGQHGGQCQRQLWGHWEWRANAQLSPRLGDIKH